MSCLFFVIVAVCVLCETGSQHWLILTQPMISSIKLTQMQLKAETILKNENNKFTKFHTTQTLWWKLFVPFIQLLNFVPHQHTVRWLLKANFLHNHPNGLTRQTIMFHVHRCETKYINYRKTTCTHWDGHRAWRSTATNWKITPIWVEKKVFRSLDFTQLFQLSSHSQSHS